MEYLKEGKRRCDRLVWQLYNKNDKLGGTRLTDRQEDVGDSSLVSSRKNIHGQSERAEKPREGG